MNLFKQTTALVVVTLLLGTAGCNKSPSDAMITGRVKMAIASDAGLQGTKVSVATNEKVVHLSGTVKSRDERAMLIAHARKVDGVKAVKTDLVVASEPKAGVKPQKTAAAKPQQKPRVEARAKRESTAQLRSTPPGPGVPPER